MINNIEISCYDIEEPLWTDQAEKFCLRVLDILKKKNWEISLVFTNNSYIQELNRDFRFKDTPTDVLSFCQYEGEDMPSGGEMDNAGDIVISLEYIDKNAKEFSVSPDEELKRLIIHGILHLSGWEHETAEPTEEMIIYQEEILKKIGEEW